MALPIRVMIVDDSIVFRAAIKAAIATEADIEVVAVAANGKIALGKLADVEVDIIIMDLEMPELDGVATTQQIRELGIASRILLFAAPTQDSYPRVHKALLAGADEFLAKPGGDYGAATRDGVIERIRSELVPRLRMLHFQDCKFSRMTELTTPNQSREHSNTHQLVTPKINSLITPVIKGQVGPVLWKKESLHDFKPSAVVIASSTGGPIALEALFAGVSCVGKRPIFIVQHMSPPFTKSLAQRLAEISGLNVREACDGEMVHGGVVYVAPAGYHMRIEGCAAKPVLRVYQGEHINYVMPAADPLFESAAQIYGSGLMSFVLTGMGQDGKAGSIAVKHAGGRVMIQDQASSIVWGMPGAVYESGAYDHVGSLQDCGAMFRKLVKS